MEIGRFYFKIGGFEYDFGIVDAVCAFCVESGFGGGGMGNGVENEVLTVKIGTVGGEFYLHFRPCCVDFNVAGGVESLGELPSGVGHKLP